MLDQTLRAAETGGVGEELQAGSDGHGSRPPSGHPKGQHAAESGHLPRGDFVARVGGEARVEHPREGRVAGGRAAAVAVASRLKLFANATSLGGPESLVEHRASSDGPGTTTPEDLLRLSVGLEHPDDLLADLLQALDASPTATPG